MIEPNKNYYVEGYGSWFVVTAKNKREAYTQGVKVWGRGGTRNVREAIKSEVIYFVAQKGSDALRKD